MDSELKKYVDRIETTTDTKEIDKILKEAYLDKNIGDYDYYDLVYEVAVPQVKKIEEQENNYEQ